MVFFRADSNSLIASGHIMRCISIASFFRSHDIDVHFIVADENPIGMLKEANMPYTILNSDWKNLSSEINRICSILRKDINPVLFIDTYSVYKGYVESLLPFAKVIYLGSKQEALGNLNCLINYSTDINKDFYSSNYQKSTKLLLGPSFAPLRQEFQNVPEHYRESIENILLTTGNTDSICCVYDILRALLKSIEGTNVTINVVIGRMYKDTARLVENYGKHPNIHLLQNVTSMSSLMKRSSLAIAANGTTVYELAACNVPIISFAMVEEQVKSAEALSKMEVIDYAGKMFSNRVECIDNIVRLTNHYIAKPQDAISLGKKAHHIMGGNGCQKIYNELKSILY